MSSSNNIPYRSFGNVLERLRKQAGIAHQSDLAAMLRVKQQTVSRWEAGLSRPRGKQLSALAKALGADTNELLSAAGYSKTPVTISFDQPFPLEALTAESFERFCLQFLDAYYPGAQVHRAGKSGHTQYGIDIKVMPVDGGCHTFQCKRVQSFGPQNVLSAVAAHTIKSDMKVILLSRIASPKAREVVQLHAEWRIWDKDDISLRIRKLPKEAQRRLVNVFFPGQQFALLGDDESGPWQTTEEFFAPFSTGKGAFRHSWKLVGRTKEKDELVKALEDRDQKILFLIGAGGAGKSRILKEAIADFQSHSTDTLVRFLSPTSNITSKNLDDFGNRKTLIIVDDAHDRTDLQHLFHHASLSSNNTRLLLAFRPYGRDYIKAQAAHFALRVDQIPAVELEGLKLADATALALQVLSDFNGPLNQADDIGRITRDCPLATVIGAQIVSQKGVNFELAKNEDVFRSTLLDKFRDIVAGSIGNKSDAESVKKLLQIIALLQPFHTEDETLPQIVESIEGLQKYETKRLVRILTDGGILFKRGGELRLSPDMLADYITEDACIGSGGISTGYAEHVFDSATTAQIENLLLNLGKLDWRLAGGDPSRSRLLDGIWKRLFTSGDSTAHLRAVTEVAFYQPARALDFAEKLMREGHHSRDIPTLFKYAAYSYHHLRRACEGLWETGKGDVDALSQSPGHGIRILAELCAVQPNKPLPYNEAFVDFGLSLLENPESWHHKYTPFDILKGILQTEGHTNTSSGMTISLHPFSVRPVTDVTRMRRKVIDSAIQFLSHGDTRIAVLAARFLNDALRYPMGGTEDDIRAAWTSEFIETLNAIHQKIEQIPLNPVVLVEIVSSISWHANHAGGETGDIADNIIHAMPQTIEFRTTRAFIDGYGHWIKFGDPSELEHKWNSYNESVLADLLAQFQDGEQLRATLECYLTNIELYYGERISSPFVLYSQLLQHSTPLAHATVEDALSREDSKTRRFAGAALSKVLKENWSVGIDAARRFLASGYPHLVAAIGEAYFARDLGGVDLAEEISLLREILASNDVSVLQSATHAVRTIAKQDNRLAIELLKSSNFGISDKVADDFLMIFHGDQVLPFSSLTGEDVEALLDKLSALPKLEGFWVERFLANAAKNYPICTLKFFTDRVERIAANKDWSFRPCNYGPYVHTPLQFRESSQLPAIFQHVSRWIESKPKEDTIFHYWSGKLFEAIFQPFDDEFISLLQTWIDKTTLGIRIISKLLDEAGPGFIFEQRSFVIRFLDRCKQLGPEYLKQAINALYSSAVTGDFSGKLGEPYPRDVEMKQKAELVLEDMSRFSAAYELYAAVKERAEENIKTALQERIAFEN